MKRIKQIILLALVGMLLLPSVKLYAGEIDILVEKLVEKGVLTRDEAKTILKETKEELKKELAEGKREGVPKWSQTLKFKGDLRLRHQADDQNKDNTSMRHRQRVRFRLGAEAKVNDSVMVGARIASGEHDPRSTNQTLDNTFETKHLMLDQAYAEFAPPAYPGLNLLGGKMPRNPVLWEPIDFLWDSDINPEGAAVALTNDFGAGDLFLNSGIFVIDAQGADNSWMAYVQPGLKWKLTDRKSLKCAITGYWFDTEGYDIMWSADTNTKTGANHKYDYDSIVPAFEFGVKDPFAHSPGLVPYAALFSEYVYASDASKNNEGWAAGFKFGDEKVKKAGQWQFKYLYRRLEQDAWLDALPDADTFTGDTHVKGYELIFERSLADNIILGFDYYHTEPIDTTAGHTSGDKEDIFQADLLFKF